MAERTARAADFLTDMVLRGLIGLALALPYRWRVPFFGWVVARLVAPVAGFGRRIRENLAHVLPGLPEAEVRRLIRAVPDNLGRTLIENYSTRPFTARAAACPMRGPGLAALEAARAAGRPVILVTGHFGNYEAPRAALIARGYTVGGLYRPMNNAFFNDHYVATMARIGGPIFPRGRQGLAGLIRHIRAGGMAVLLNDQYFRRGAELPFFGQPAPTTLSAAEMALKYGADLIPFYGIRAANGLDFDLVFEAPVPHGDALGMTAALNASLEAQVRAHMGQWFWIHRRWKPERQRSRAEPSTGPGPSA